MCQPTHEKSLYVYQIQEKGHSLHRAIFFKITFEKLSRLHVDSHGGKHNSKVVIAIVLYSRNMKTAAK